MSYPSVEDAARVTGNVFLTKPITDLVEYQTLYTQLTDTQAFLASQLLVAICQYPIFSFDGNLFLFSR